MSHRRIKNNSLNGVSIIAGIIACLYLGSWPALLVTTLLLAFHRRISLPGEWRLIIQVTVIGWLYDAILLRSGVMEGAGQPGVWQLCVWALLASGLRHALGGLQNRFAWTPAAGVLIGCALYLMLVWITPMAPAWPLPYWLALIGLSWALLMPLLVFIAGRVVQVTESPVI